MQRVEILPRFRNKYLRIIVNAPWYVTNDILRHDLNVRNEIKRFCQRYADRMEKHRDQSHESQNNAPIKKKIISRSMYLIVL